MSRASPIKRVEVDAQTFLRISKHANEMFPAPAQGSLLGLDGRDGVLRVTSCFAYKARREGEENDTSFVQFQEEMLESLSDVRQDANVVGSYDSSHHGNFLTESFIENQYLLQKAIPCGVVLCHTPFQQKIGKFGFRAYRLTQAAMDRKANGTGEDDFIGSHSKDLVEEIPVYVHNSPLIDCFLLQWADETEGGFDVVLGTDDIPPSLEKNVELVLDTLDEFQIQQREMLNLERQQRGAKPYNNRNAGRVPRTIDTLNLSKQIQKHCDSLEALGADSHAKLQILGLKGA